MNGVDIASLSSKPELQNYAQGAARNATNSLANLIAPTVEVPTSLIRYKKHVKGSTYKLPDTRRAEGGRATELSFSKTDAEVSLSPNALDFPIERELASEEEGTMALQEAADHCAFIGALSWEAEVFTKAKAALSATSLTWGSSAQPIRALNEKLLAIIKAGHLGGPMTLNIVFGPTAWLIFSEHANVTGKIVTAAVNAKGVGTATVTEQNANTLLMGSPQTRIAYMTYDAAPEGKADTPTFFLDSQILIFASNPTPNRFDYSFAKTFRLRNRWMRPGTYQRDDGRVTVAKFDWVHHVDVTNAAAGALLTISE